MLRLGSLLVLSTILLSAAHGEAEARFEEKDVKNVVPLEFLTFSSGNDMETMFGYEIIEYIHRERMRCDILNRKEELKFIDKFDHMTRYFKQTKQTIMQPEFEELAFENKKDVEANFQKAFKDIEVNHFRKLSRMQTDCDDNIKLYMDDRLQLVMDYATTLLKVEKAQFSQLLTEMIEYQNQLQSGLASCIAYMEMNKEKEHFERAGMYYDLCYGTEVITLIEFITKFTTLAEQLAHEPKEKGIVQLPVETTPKNKSPLEVENYEASGKGEHTNPPKKVEKTEEKPTATVPMKYTDMEKETKPSPQTDPSKPPITRSQPPTTSEESKPPTTTDPNLDLEKEFVNYLEPGPVILPIPINNKEKSNDKDKSEEPELSIAGKEGYKKVMDMLEAAKVKDDLQQSRRSHSKFEDKSDPGLSIDLDLPGVDVQIDTNGIKIDAQGAGEEVIVFDGITTTGEPTREHHGKHDLKTMFFIYFFATLGILLTITLVILIVIVTRLKLSRSKPTKKDTPLLSEQEKIAVMKQSGYVNPTYKFFDDVKDV